MFLIWLWAVTVAYKTFLEWTLFQVLLNAVHALSTYLYLAFCEGRIGFSITCEIFFTFMSLVATVDFCKDWTTDHLVKVENIFEGTNLPMKVVVEIYLCSQLWAWWSSTGLLEVWKHFFMHILSCERSGEFIVLVFCFFTL